MSVVDYQFWRGAASAGGVTDCSQNPSACNLSGLGSSSIGPQKYIGDLTITNRMAATMKGPIYVTGNLTIYNFAHLDLDQSFGSNGTVLIVDGTVSTITCSCMNPTNANPKGNIFVATLSTSPTAININYASSFAIFYALNGGARLVTSGKITELVANSLYMEAGAELDYDQGLGSANFTTGPGASWQIKKGTYRISS